MMAPALRIEGFWGKQTATIDWCEENYVVSYYIAEFWNTVSNFVMIFAPLWMVYIGIKEKHEKTFIYSFLSLSVVGIGSWLFHMTLLYSMQLMDELPMIWGTSVMTYAVYVRDTRKDNYLIQFGLFVYCAGITLIYLIVKEPLFHEIAYSVMAACNVYLGTKTFIRMNSSRFLYFSSLISYVLGAMFWQVDNVFCHRLRSIRSHPVGEKSGMLFECHAWWHILAGTGTYIYILFILHTRLLFLQKHPQIKFLFKFWPYVSLSKEVKLR